MAFYGSPKLEHGRVAKPHSNLPDQKTMDVISYKIKVHKLMLLKRKKEEEFAKNWDLKKELAKRNERRKRVEAMDPAVWKKHKMSPEEICEGVKLLIAARREGMVTGDRSVLRQDIDIDSGSLDTFRICVRGPSTPNYADDAYGSLADKMMKIDFLKADKSSADDPAEFEKEQGTAENSKKTM